MIFVSPLVVHPELAEKTFRQRSFGFEDPQQPNDSPSTLLSKHRHYNVLQYTPVHFEGRQANPIPGFPKRRTAGGEFCVPDTHTG
jgi:hypothetical protein